MCLETCTSEQKCWFANSSGTEDPSRVLFVIAQMLQSDEHVAGKCIQWGLGGFRRDCVSDGFAMKCDLAADIADNVAATRHTQCSPWGPRRIGAGKYLV